VIPGPVLAAWIANREAQGRSYRRVDACAQKWSVHPLMTQIEREVSELAQRTPDNLLAAARRFMDRTGDIDALMGELIATSRLDPFFRPPLLPVTADLHSSLLLYDHPELSIALGVSGVDDLAAKKSGGRGPASVNFPGYVILLRFVDAGGATMSFWEAPRIGENFVGAEAGPCRMVGRRRIADGEEVVLDGRYQSFVIDHAERAIVYYQAVARAQCAPVAAEYDSETLRFIGASSTDEAASRIQMMVSLLRALDREDALPLFEKALEDSPFYARWHIMREMLALDADAALPALRAMAAGDPHPDVRAAARQSLELFFEDEQEDEVPADRGGAACRA
jgi:hypothetical protein